MHDNLGSREDGHATTVVHVGGLHYASEKAVVERVLANRPAITAAGLSMAAMVADMRNRFLVALVVVAARKGGAVDVWPIDRQGKQRRNTTDREV